MSNVKDHGNGFRIAFNIILIVFSAILISNIIRNIFHGDAVSFSSFLDFLGSVPQIEFNGLETIHFSTPWVILDEFRIVLNALVTPINLLIFLGSNLINCILYIFYFFKFLFVV